MASEPTSPEVITIPKPEVKPAIDLVVINQEELEKRYRVIIENDDVTPMEFVVLVLQGIFELSAERSFQVMLEAHNIGMAHVITLPFQDASDRVYTAQSLAREAGFPLSFYLEPEE